MKRSHQAALLIGWVLGVGLLAAVLEGFVPRTIWQLLLALLLIGPLLLFGEAILELLFEVVGYAVGRLALPCVSLGRARAERAGEGVSFPWYAVARGRHGEWIVSADAVALLGLLVLALATLLGWLAWA